MDFLPRRVRLDPSEKPRDCGGDLRPAAAMPSEQRRLPQSGGQPARYLWPARPATAEICPGVHAEGGAATPGLPPVSYDREHEGRVETLRTPEGLR